MAKKKEIPTSITYHFPFSLPAKERERAKAIKRGNKWSAMLYSPSSTKKFYEKIRTYIMHHYPNYESVKVDYLCEIELIVGTTRVNDDCDLDNRLKMLDSLNRDGSRMKDVNKFKGIWKDDKFIKKITTEVRYVDEVKDEYTILTLKPFTPSEH